MLLALNIQNTCITMGCFRKGKLTTVTQLAAEPHHTADQYACAMKDILELYGVERGEIGGAVLCSVVPTLSEVIRQAVTTLFHCHIIEVSAGVKTGLNIKVDHPHLLGSDLVSLAVAAAERKKNPCVVVDLGTATTFTALDRNGTLVGTAIAPGLMVSLEGLREHAAQLPMVTLNSSPSVLGRNTSDAIRSGVLNGTACMADGMLQRMRAELGDDMTVYLTGQYAHLIMPLMTSDAVEEEYLALNGLRLIWERNKRKNG